LRQRSASRLLIPSERFLSTGAIEGGRMRACVRAIMWMVELSFRFPARLRRWRFDLPDDTGEGAVLACMAKADSDVKRDTPAVSPTRCAAPITEHPGNARSSGTTTRGECADLLLGPADRNGELAAPRKLIERDWGSGCFRGAPGARLRAGRATRSGPARGAGVRAGARDHGSATADASECGHAL